MTVTSRIRAQTAIKVTNRVFQPRIYERERKKKNRGAYANVHVACAIRATGYKKTGENISTHKFNLK